MSDARACLVMLFILSIVAIPSLRGQWTQTSGPEGGNISCLISYNGFTFAGTTGAGVMRSSDNGATWAPMNNGFGFLAPTGFLVKGTTLYSSTVNVFRTTDNGATWVGGTGLPAGNSVMSLATDGTNIYAGITSSSSSALVYRSTNDGATWQQFSTGSAQFVGVSALCVNGSDVYAGTAGDGVFRSTNQGQSWSAVSSGLPSFSYINTLVASGGVLFAGTSNTGMYRSTNNGSTWTTLNSGLPSGSTITSIYVDNADLYVAATIFTTPAEVYKSTNGGGTWTSLSSTLPPSYINTVAKFGTTVFVGTLGRGLIRSTDNGATWLRSNSGIINTWVSAVATSGTTVFAGTSDDGVYRSTDGGANWTWMMNGMPDNLKAKAIVTRGNMVFVIGVEGESVYAFRTSDNGQTWTRGATGIPFSAFPSNPSQRTAIVAGNDLLVTLNSNTVWRSTDDGNSWSGSTGISFDEIRTLGANGGYVYAGGNGIYRSTDGGSTWTSASTGLPSFAGFVSIASAEGNIYAVRLFGASVHRSTNNGDTWSAVASLPGSTGSDLLSIGSNLFAGINNGGVALSTNGGSSWTLIRTGLPLQGIVYHILANDATHLYCGTDVRGVWKRPISDVVGVGEVGNSLPGSFSLEQNYPNPFNPSTNIGFRIVDFGFVSLKVYDLLGREVSTLVNEVKEPGSYEVAFDAAGLASGVYFYRLEARPQEGAGAGQVATGKALLIK